jgi:hypothetical protein
MLERMHGAIRYLKSVPGAGTGSAGPAAAEPAAAEPAAAEPAAGGSAGGSAGLGDLDDPGDPMSAAILDRPQVPWWDPGSDSSVSPETDHVVVSGVRVARGSRVRMRPGTRRADAQDLHDVDGQVHVAVSPEADPMADLQRNHGRFLYFAPDELEPIEDSFPIEGGEP